MFKSYTDEQVDRHAAELAAARGRDWATMHSLARRGDRMAARAYSDRMADRVAIAYAEACRRAYWHELGRDDFDPRAITAARYELDAAQRAAYGARAREQERARAEFAGRIAERAAWEAMTADTRPLDKATADLLRAHLARA